MSEITYPVAEPTASSLRSRSAKLGLAAYGAALVVAVYGAYGDAHPKSSHQVGIT